jgi:hypothetical protein
LESKNAGTAQGLAEVTSEDESCRYSTYKKTREATIEIIEPKDATMFQPA